MAATTTHNTGAAGERQVAMTANFTSIPEVAALRSEWVAANSGKPERILSALGLPGFGRKFATEALARMATTGCNAHQACLGR